MKSELLKLLKEKNIKITNERKAIIEVLRDTKVPLSPAELLLRIRSGLPKANLTTVYRNLEMLEGYGLLKRISFHKSGFSYELVSDRVHHHHIICRNCGAIEDLENISEKFIEEIQNRSNFKIEDHNLELIGVCEKCQKP